MPIQIAPHQPPAVVSESRKTQSHAVAAAQIHHRPRAHVFGGKQSRQQYEDPIQPQFPAHECAIAPRASGKHPIHKTNAFPYFCLRQSGIGGRPQPHHNRRNRRPCTAHECPQHHAPHPPGQQFFFHVRARQRGKVKRPKCSAPQKIADLHRAHDNRALQQRIVDEGARHRQRLVQPEEQRQSNGRKGLKSIDGHDPDEEPQKHRSRGSARRKVLFQQGGDELPQARLKSSDHSVPVALVRRMHCSRMPRSPISPTPPTARRSRPSPRPPTPFPRCTRCAQPRSASWFQCAVPGPESPP